MSPAHHTSTAPGPEGLDPVGQLNEPLGAGEQPRLKVGEKADGKYIDLQLVNDPRKLIHLFRGVELRLVAHQIVDPVAAGELGHHIVPEVQFPCDLDRRLRETEAR